MTVWVINSRLAHSTANNFQGSSASLAKRSFPSSPYLIGVGFIAFFSAYCIIMLYFVVAVTFSLNQEGNKIDQFALNFQQCINIWLLEWTQLTSIHLDVIHFRTQEIIFYCYNRRILTNLYDEITREITENENTSVSAGNLLELVIFFSFNQRQLLSRHSQALMLWHSWPAGLSRSKGPRES